LKLEPSTARWSYGASCRCGAELMAPTWGELAEQLEKHRGHVVTYQCRRLDEHGDGLPRRELLEAGHA